MVRFLSTFQEAENGWKRGCARMGNMKLRPTTKTRSAIGRQ